MIKNNMRPVHPGEVLREEYLNPLGLRTSVLAHRLQIPVSRLENIVREQRGITADTALRLSRYFGGNAQSWMNLQTAFDLRSAELSSGLQADLHSIEPMRPTSE